MIIEISGLAVSIASMCASLASIRIAQNSLERSDQALSQAKDVADRSRADWRQQQWFTLFIEADAAYDLLDRFQSLEKASYPVPVADKNAAMEETTFQIKKSQNLATVFPKCTEVDALFEATEFLTPIDYSSKEKLETLFEAVEGLRQRALVMGDVLIKSE